MKHIRRVLIENFQSHARTELTFSPGLNVIIGPSDNGKSAVLRAIRWALYNEPRGTEFVRHGARECRVTVTMSDGAEVVRELLLSKSGASGRSRYIVRVPGKEPQVFEGFGAQVPLEVLRAHGMPQVQLDTDKRVLLNLGSQLEGPFLMAESGSFRARALGRLLGVHVVDAAVRNTQKDLRTAKNDVAKLEERLQRYDEELQQFADIPEQEARLEQAEALLDQADALSRRLAVLERIQAELARTQSEAAAAKQRLALLGGLGQAEQRLHEAELQQYQASRLERLQADHNRVEQEIQRTTVRVDALTALPLAAQLAQQAAERQTRLAGLSKIAAELKQREAELHRVEQAAARLAGASRAADLLEEAARKQQRLAQLEERLARWTDLTQRMTTGQQMLRDEALKLKRHTQELEAVLTRLGRCPTCLQPVEPAAVRRILAELAEGTETGHYHEEARGPMRRGFGE